MADRAAFPAKNSHCICCTKSLRLLTRKHRCHLCGHYVCDRCWSLQEMETQTTRRITPVRVCSRCIEFVENGDYSAVKPSSLGNLEVRRDPANQPPANKTLARLLRRELRSSSGSRKNSVRTVIQYLVNQEEEEEQAKAERQAKDETETRSIRLTSDSADHEYLDALDGGLSIHQVPLYQCVLANALKRDYPITMPKTAANGSIPDAPIPLNEKERLDAIARSRIMELEDASELDMLCSLAATQLDCKFSIVTVVTAEHMTVLGANLENLRRVQLPREHSFCQHTVMTSKPLLVPHPEADVRFQNINGRAGFDVRFYCGFPIVGEDNRTVIGSFCCMDQKTHEFTQSQYSAMKKLAYAAGLVVQSKNRQADA
ncbi:FYVE finger-containing protein [Phytophthora cinnamomi]|uniref:FYVE finger-containing protein n=1 Tax=Phytophthora cinnamomi TaxID=4785 RepID=UPI00355A2744|nr:FYVE finger-containing protein [Phytophthora cinnamomi]